ncbi:hypothetical protein COV06_03220 [Candidatus Uhrbacteria bacterium CG10_big_fil_rev_8_21_14_0_10_50_16]|uniref:Uncharacterized protein n=1 Tax=Candidatus Uhrbacteria bacterium CG10_big_fil_rev_8_21_14_0_10_50_16 TaxID=1975039 RepID=A0A2H0RLS1_9BACT|nr:MAG: hypothetical protein COV06_03220 [Candidatus Uhrbacteria bacterium CG10_big_fil_rev_8_21_14_0_10_50_16]
MSLAGAQRFDTSVSAGVVHHGVDLLQYGVARDHSARPVSAKFPHIFVQQQGVMVSGEYIHPLDQQHKVTNVFWEDRSRQDATTALERTYRYAELVDGRIALQEIQQRDEVDRVDQQLLRAFNASGLIEGETFLVNESVRAQRWCQYTNGQCLILEERYSEDGQLTDRNTFAKSSSQMSWSVSGSTIQNGYESLYIKQPVLTLPSLSGFSTRHSFAPVFMLPIDNERLFSFER